MSERDIAAEIANVLSLNMDDIFHDVKPEAARPGSQAKDAPLGAYPNAGHEHSGVHSETASYIFDRMVASMSDLRQQWRAEVVDALNRSWGDAEFARVLDYGGGVGTDALYFAENCRAAFYFDLSGHVGEFATKRFAQRGVPIVQVTNTKTYDAEFDAVVSFELPEPLANPQAHLDEIVRLTKPGGMLFLTESFGLTNEDTDSHLAQDNRVAGNLDEFMLSRGCRPHSMAADHVKVYVKGPGLSVIVPIHNAYDHVCRLLDSIGRTTPGYPVTWMLVNDASTDPRILPRLNEFAASCGIMCRVVNRAQNGGFTLTCNDAMAAAGSDDVILLNSDTILYDCWARRLLEAAYEDSHIGTATPLSNNGSAYSIFQYVNPVNRLNASLADAEQPAIDIPVGVGFCLYIKREVLDRVGMFDPIFGRGYGEETDLCLRATAAGYRHVLATRSFVYHAGSASMIAAEVVRKGERTIEEHERIIAKRYPDFVPSVHTFIASGVVESLARDLSRRYVARESAQRPSIAFIVHDDVFSSVIGGTTYHIQDLIRHLERDFVFYFMSPVATKVQVSAYVDGVVSTFVSSTDDYRRLLPELNPSVMHIHHLMGFPPSFIDALTQWQGQKIYTIHDYYAVCPQFNLINYQQVYCGVPARDECGRCFRELFGTGYAMLEAHRRTFQRLIDSVTTVIAPSHAALNEFRKAIIVPEGKTHVIPHAVVTGKKEPVFAHLFDSLSEQVTGNHAKVDANNSATTGDIRDTVSTSKLGTKSRPATGVGAAAARASISPKSPEVRLRVGFIGYNSPHKGNALVQEIVTACLEDPITFIGIGDIGEAIQDNENVITTGRFRREEATELVKRYQADVVVIASNWPETYCYTLSETWMAGVPVIVGPFGAPAERVAESGAGLVVPEYRAESFVAALRRLVNDQAHVAQLKQMAAAVSMPHDYGEYDELYRQHIHCPPSPSLLFSSPAEQDARSGRAPLSEVPVIAKLVAVRKRVFPVGSTRERMYFWLHNRISNGYAGSVKH